MTLLPTDWTYFFKTWCRSSGPNDTNFTISFEVTWAEMTHHLWLANSEGVSHTSTREELPQQEILQAWWHSPAAQKRVWVGDQMGHHADALFSSVGCAGFCNKPQHPHVSNNTSREESFHSLIEEVQNEKKQRYQLVSAEAFWCRLPGWEWSKTYISDSTWALPLQILFPLISCHDTGTIPSIHLHSFIHSTFSSVFPNPPSGLHNQTWKTSSVTGAAATWARSQPARVVCPALKATCVISASHLAPERCKLPFLFYYFLPFIDDHASFSIIQV